MEINWLNLMNLKNKNIFNELVEERASEFQNLGKLINSDTLIYKYKTEGRRSNVFRNYQNSVDLFKHIRAGYVSTDEVLRNQI